MVCAGWFLQPMVAPLAPLPDTSSIAEVDTDTITASSILQPYHQHHPHCQSGGRLKEVLAILCEYLPESVRIRSGNHGMTPSEYLASSMEDSKEKQECLDVLELGGATTGEDVEVTPTGPLEQLTKLADPNAYVFDDFFHALFS